MTQDRAYHRHDVALSLDRSETIALRALGFLGAGSDVRPVTRDRLQQALDILITDEHALLTFAALIDVPPEAAYEARRTLGRIGQGR